MHFDAGFSAYNHPPYNFPSSFGPNFQVGASPPNHGLPAHPPLPVGHHALDAAMARAYVDGQGPAMYHTQAIPFEPANPPVFGFPPSRNPSPPNRQLARSSTLYTNRHSQRNGQHGLHRRNVSARTHGRGSPFADMSHGAHPITPPPSVPDKNILNVDSIASGGDTRTTVMIKNIPNKMTDEDLLSFINRVSPGRIDFFYLRMDFTNGKLVVAMPSWIKTDFLGCRLQCWLRLREFHHTRGLVALRQDAARGEVVRHRLV